MAQKINIDGYSFWGYYTLEDSMKEEGGVYVIFNGQGEDFIDVGQTDNLNDRPRNHERKPCWERNCQQGIFFAATLEPDQDKRLIIEKAIRNNHPEMPCGEF